METQPSLWAVRRMETPIPCCNHNCQEEAQHLERFWHGQTAVDVCLCEDCLRQVQIAQAVLGVFHLPFQSDGY